MKRYGVVIAFLACCLRVAAAQDAQKDMTALQGAWKIVDYKGPADEVADRVAAEGEARQQADVDNHDDAANANACRICPLRQQVAHAVGQIGDARLLLMAALLISDELATAKKELLRLAGDRTEAEEDQLAESIERLASRVEAIAARLEAA